MSAPMRIKCNCGRWQNYVGTYAEPRTDPPAHGYMCERADMAKPQTLHDGIITRVPLVGDELAEWSQALATEALRLAFGGEDTAP